MIDEVDAFFLRAFWDLNTERPIGMGEGRIPWSAIVRYGFYNQLGRGITDALIQITKALDEAYLGWREKNKPST